MLPVLRTLMAALLLAAACPAAVFAASFEKGLRVGANYANFRGEFADLADTKAMIGFAGGAFVALEVSPNLAVQTEVLFTRKGAKMTSEATDEAGNPLGSFDTFIRVDYLEVPVLLRGTLLATPAVQPMIYAGPTFGFPLQGKLVTDYAGVPDVKLEDLESVDFGAAFGLGIGARLAGHRLFADLRYTTGFGDIFHRDRSTRFQWWFEPVANSVNSVYSLSVGIGF